MSQHFSNLDCDARTVFYAAGEEADAIPLIEIRAHVTEAGWDTLAFVDATWPAAQATAEHIVRCLATHAELVQALQAAANYLADDLDESDATELRVFRKLRAALARGTAG